MGIYHFYLEIPANTPENSPITHKVNCNVGTLTQLEIYYPLNNKRQAGVWFESRGSQILPTNTEGYFTGNGTTSKFNPEILILDDKMTMYGFNTDQTYDHRIDAWVNIVDDIGVQNGF